MRLISIKGIIFPLSTSLLFLLASVCSAADSGIGVDAEMGTLVSTEWLSQHLDDPDLVVLDSTVLMVIDETGSLQSGNARANYEAGHIPTAGFADLLGDLSDQSSSLEFSLPTAEQFTAAMGALGVGDKSRVVLYDSNGMMWAARVWWMLRWVGFDRAALLDGGLKAWKEEGRPLSTELPDQTTRHLTPVLRANLIADQDEVFAAIGNSAVSLIDAMPESHFRGDFVLYERSGHIPGASNIPSAELLDETGHFRSLEQLSAMFNADRDNRAITYCGGGISAAADAYIMTRLGFNDVAVYISSLQEWAADFDMPLVTDSP